MISFLLPLSDYKILLQYHLVLKIILFIKKENGRINELAINDTNMTFS